MYRLTLQRCSQWKEIVWGPKFPSTVQSKALCYPVLERRDVITTARKCCPVQVEPGVLGDHSRICTDCGLVCSSRQAILITKVSGFVLGCWVVFFKNFFLGFLLITFSPSYHQTQLVRNSDRGLPIFWMSSLKLLETTAFIPTKPVLFLQKEVSFLCDVTVVDVLQCNHMFVKLFVPCKLMNQTILGFQSAFVSKNIFASIEM